MGRGGTWRNNDGLRVDQGHLGHIRAVCPNAVIVLGGGVLTSLPREMMAWLPEVDVGCIGEGFVTFPEILELVDQG